MKYLELFESRKVIKTYWKIDYSEYQEAVFDIHSLPSPNKDVVSLTYRQQESIISFFNRDYKVFEDLNSELFVDDAVVIGFNPPKIRNKYMNEVCCWINIRNIKKYNPTKKHPSGRKLSTNTYIHITKLEDEWFYIHLKSKSIINHNGVNTTHDLMDGYYRCDQLDGLIQLFNENIHIK
jgi:hypothetical protein